MSDHRHATGYEPDLYDYRDRIFSPGLVAGDLPSGVDPIDSDFPIYDQNGDNACVGFTYKEAAQIVLLNEFGIRTSISAGFLWWLGRSALGWQDRNSGCRIRDVIQAANRDGVCSDALHPWVPGQYAIRPSGDAFAQAKDHPALRYEAVETSLAAKAALAQKHPVLFGTVLTTSFDRTGRTGLFAPPNGNVTGAHAMLLVAYDDDYPFPEWGADVRGGFKVRNSWTARWGLSGWCWMPYLHFDNPAVQDAWVLRAIKG